MNRPSAMLPQRMRFTCWHSSPGDVASVANARTAAWRFDMSSAAGIPLPTTSAIDRPSRDAPNAIASKQSPPTPAGWLPRRRDLAAVDLGQHRWQQLALNPTRFIQRPRLERLGVTPHASLLDFRAKRVRAAVCCPTVSARSRRRLDAWFRRRGPLSPSRS